MKKIILSVLAIVLTLGVVGGSAYALFSSTATVQGIAISTGNAGLKIWDGDSYETTWTSTDAFNGMYPGESRTTTWYLRNDSTSAISLDVTGQLMSAGGDWAELQVIKMKADGNSLAPAPEGPLTDWNSTPVSLGNILQNTTATYLVTFTLPSASGNEVAGKSLNNVTFNFVGTEKL